VDENDGRKYFGHWRATKEEPWSQGQLYTCDDALKTYLRLLHHRSDLVPIGNEPSFPNSCTRHHWADIELSEYHRDTVGSQSRTTRMDTVRATHACDDTIVTTLRQTYQETWNRLDQQIIWTQIEFLRGNLPVLQYPQVLYHKCRRVVRLHVVTRSQTRGGLATDRRIPTWPGVLYEDTEQKQWYVLREPMTFSELAAKHLKFAKLTPNDQKWVFGGTVKGLEHVKFMVCQDRAGNQHGKIVAKDVEVMPGEERCDPKDLDDEPCEVYLNQKIKANPYTNCILQMDSVFFKHSDTIRLWKLCMRCLSSQVWNNSLT